MRVRPRRAHRVIGPAVLACLLVFGMVSGVSRAGPSAAGASACPQKIVPFNHPFFLEVWASRMRGVDCAQADEVGRPLYRFKQTASAKYLPPPPTGVRVVRAGPSVSRHPSAA